MELSWTTFLLEAINFLVLVWLLKRLFYAPVKRAIEQRRAAVEKTLQDAQSTKQEAETLKSRYEGRLREWEQEKENQREHLRNELDEERNRQMKLVETSVAMEREKLEALEGKKAAERRASDEEKAIRHALAFTSRLFGALASPEVEGKIVDLVTKKLASSQTAGFPAINGSESSNAPGAVVQVRSAYALSEPQRNALAAVLQGRIRAGTPVTFDIQPELLAGIEITVGAFVLRANLRDELGYFSTTGNYDQR